MENITIALYDDALCGSSPVMPYVGERYCGKDFTYIAKLYLAAALLRCGFDVLDAPAPRADIQDVIMRVNRAGADALIMLSYAAFGSRRSFNDAHGFAVRFPLGRFAVKSRVMCEDVCAKLALTGRDGGVGTDGLLGAVNCPAAVIDAGYLTNFDEAKLVTDPDFALEFAEHTAMGLCEHFCMPYVGRDDAFSYPLLGVGRRGKKVKMLQCLLNVHGARLAPDGVFGGETDKAVKAFCVSNGKPKDGAVTPEVWCDLLLSSLPELTLGSESCAALYIQRKLKSKLYPAPQNGVFDDATLDCVNAFLTDSVGAARIQKNGAVTADVFKLIGAIGGGKPRLF